MEKAVIYQIFTRVCCNSGGKNVSGGDIRTNGSGKLNSFTPTVLEQIKSMGVTPIWFTGLIAHASCTSYKSFGIPESHSGTVKAAPAHRMPYVTIMILIRILPCQFLTAWQSSRHWWTGFMLPV